MKKQNVPNKLKVLVKDAMRRHAWNIGVSHYVGDILYMENDAPSTNGNTLEADMVVDRRYLKATMRIYPHAVEHWKKDGNNFIEHLVAHEVAHIATQHLFDVAIATYRDEGEMKDAWETLTEVVGRMSEKLDRQLKK